MHTVLDAVDTSALADFYSALLGLGRRAGDDEDWVVLLDDCGRRVLAVQRVDELPRATWPAPGVPQQLHLDLAVPDVEALHRERARAVALGAQPLMDRSDDPDEPLQVLADPAGHPFCLLVNPAESG